jgi:diguanylate cyclase (GGDEF)-like protein/PAS domain S-box-containing protein
MLEQPRRVVARFTVLMVSGFALAPLVGLAGASLFGLTDPAELQRVLNHGALPLFLLAMLAWTGFHFSRYLRPLADWAVVDPQGDNAPAHLHRRLARFSRQYWGLFLLYALCTPAIYFYALGGGLSSSADSLRFLNFLLLQFSGAMLVGLAVYLLAQDLIGQLVSRLSLDRVQLSLKSKMLLLGGFVPLLCYFVLMQYHWLHTGSLSAELLTIWLSLAAITAATSVLAIRGTTQALAPVQDMLGRSGASTHLELAQLRPQSTDEIGYLTQTLGRVFQRLGDQESLMRAVVDTAAEGIIVTDETGTIDTFNPAAERLFGYRAAEMRGRPLSTLLPALQRVAEACAVGPSEREMQGFRRDGEWMQMSVRMSEMDISGRRMFTCMVADITQRKAAEANLLHAEARYRDLVETAHDLVWSTDAAGNWTYLNRACKGIYGYEPEQMLGRHVSEFKAPDHAHPDGDCFQRLLQGEELLQYETVHLDSRGEAHHLSFNAKAHFDEQGRVMRISGTARDITEQKAFQQQLTYHAEHDSLTGLFNRHYFQQELERTVARVARRGATCALFYIDLDQFKYVNDTLGHAAGDRLLVEVTHLLGEHVRDGDLLARFGGDEFTLLLYNIEPSDVLKVADHFRALFEGFRFVEDGNPFNVSCSIGATLIDQSVGSAEEALSHADIACNLAKAQGRNRINLYDPEDTNKAGMAEDMGWAARVREMLEQDRFRLVYQPIVSVHGGQAQDYEVLVRMHCDDGEVILPGGFMPAAERFGLIHCVDRWIVSRAMQQLAKLRSDNDELRFSINLSGKAFEDDALLPLIKRLLRETGLDPAWLSFEITETAAIANLSAAARFIGSLKDIGCQFALDDFGSGFSSFAYLKHLPVDKLKIDGTFVQNMAQSGVDQAMVKSMNEVAHALGKQTIAEYVENRETLELLREIGVDYAQGNFIGRPREALVSLARIPFTGSLAQQS